MTPLPTLYEQLGEARLFAVLDDLYTRLFDDPMVGFLFAGHDREHIVAMQMMFTRRLLGDTQAPYTGKSIPDAHATLPILPGHFDRRHRVLAEVLEAHRVPDDVRAVWLRLDQALRPSVLRAGRERISELNAPAETGASAPVSPVTPVTLRKRGAGC